MNQLETQHSTKYISLQLIILPLLYLCHYCQYYCFYCSDDLLYSNAATFNQTYSMLMPLTGGLWTSNSSSSSQEFIGNASFGVLSQTYLIRNFGVGPSMLGCINVLMRAKGESPCFYVFNPDMLVCLYSTCLPETSMSYFFKFFVNIESYENINIQLLKMILSSPFSLPFSKLRFFPLIFHLPIGVKAVDPLLFNTCLKWCLQFTSPKNKHN